MLHCNIHHMEQWAPPLLPPKQPLRRCHWKPSSNICNSSRRSYSASRRCWSIGRGRNSNSSYSNRINSSSLYDDRVSVRTMVILIILNSSITNPIRRLTKGRILCRHPCRCHRITAITIAGCQTTHTTGWIRHLPFLSRTRTMPVPALLVLVILPLRRQPPTLSIMTARRTAKTTK